MKIKLLFIIALAVTPLALLTAATDTSGIIVKKGFGTSVAGKPTEKAGMHGTTAIQNVATDTADQTLQDHGLKAPGQDYSVRHKTVSLSAAEIIAMYTTPKVLIAAPGAGKSIIVAKVALTMTRSSTAFTGGAAAIVQYDSTANGAGTQALDSTIAATVVTGSAGTTVTVRNGAVISDLASTSIQNKGLYISNGTAGFAAGTGTASVDVWYYVY
jgi:hypothetical protein